MRTHVRQHSRNVNLKNQEAKLRREELKRNEKKYGIKYISKGQEGYLTYIGKGEKGYRYETELFNLSTSTGIKNAEKYKAKLNEKYNKVKVEPYGLNKILIWGENPL